jgi:hypothetical protein
MKEVDQLLEDAALVESVYDAQGKRHRKSRTHGRTQTPAEVALRLLILKHVRNWSYDTLEREVRANQAIHVAIAKANARLSTAPWKSRKPRFPHFHSSGDVVFTERQRA